MKTGPDKITLSAEEAFELSELLDFVACWVRSAPPTLAWEFASFVGEESDYSLTELSERLVFFASLLLTAHKAGAR